MADKSAIAVRQRNEPSYQDEKMERQNRLFDGKHPDLTSGSEKWDQGKIRRSIDELFSLMRQYRSSSSYGKLLEFIAKFRFYSPFNAMLTHVQMPGATFAAPPYRWQSGYGRRIRAGARPLVILQPMGPVMFVFDVSDTEPEKGAPSLPPEIEHPFEVRIGQIGGEYEQTIKNSKRDGVNVIEREAGSQSAGAIQPAKPGKSLQVLVKLRPRPEYKTVPLRYELLLNRKHSTEAKYATLVHELSHLYCGHLGTPNDKWWPDRTGLTKEIREFEAESICYLVCSRLGIQNPSAEYLATCWKEDNGDDIPPISLERVIASAGLIERMGCERLKPRKEK